MNINFYQSKPCVDNNFGGGCPTGYPPQFTNTSESYLCSGQAMNDKMERELEHERRIAQSRTSYDDMPDFVKQNYVGPKYGTQEYQQEMYAKYGDRAPNYIKPEKVQQMIQNDYSEPRPYTPGMNGPIECTRDNGVIDYINTVNMGGGFEPIAPKYENPINQYATESIDNQAQPQVYDQVMVNDYYQPNNMYGYDTGFGQPIMAPPQPDPYMQQPSFTYDQYGNMVPVQQQQFTYDQFGNMIPLQPQYMYNQFGNTNFQQQPVYDQLSVKMSSGEVYHNNPYIKQQIDPGYIQSGTTTYTNGFNPYNMQSTGNAYLDYMNSSNAPFMTSIRNPYTGASITYNLRPYGQTDFDIGLRDIIYNMDLEHYMQDIPYDMLISDEERRVAEQKRREEDAASIYNMNYGLPTMQQYNAYRSEFEQFKNDTCDLFSRLHKANNFYFGKEYTEEEDKIVREMHNPLKRIEDAMEINKQQYGFGVNYGKLSPSEIKDMQELQKVRQTKRIAADIDREINYLQPMRDQIRAAIYKKIKDSHDQLLGVKPGEHYNLDYFLNHGHELVRNAYMSGKISQIRAEKFKRYNPDRFKTTIYNHTAEAQRDGIRPEFLAARQGILVEGEFSEDKAKILKNLYERSGERVLDVYTKAPNREVKKDYFRLSTDMDEAKSLIETQQPTLYERRMRQYKAGVDDLVDQFHQIQAVYGDRRGKRWWK